MRVPGRNCAGTRIFPLLSSFNSLLITDIAVNRFKLILLPAVLVFASCADEGNEPAPAAGREISFNFTQDAPAASRAHDDAPLAPRPFTLVSDDAADTTTLQAWMTVDDMSAPAMRPSRGLPVTGADGITGFKAYSFYYSAADAVPTVFFADEDVTRAGTNLYQTSQKYFWPDAGKNLSFRALVGATDASTKVTLSATAPGEIDIDYTVPAQAADQPDLMLARTAPLNTPGTPVPLSFTHLCTQVKFVIGSQMQPGTIKSITLSGIKSHGVYAATDGWTVTDTEREFTITPGRATTGTETPGTLIPAEELTLMMLPQTLSPTARLTVEFQNKYKTYTMSAPLTGSWTMGKVTAYSIGISPKPEITLDEVIPEQDATYVVWKPTVTIKNAPEGTQWRVNIAVADNPHATLRPSVQLAAEVNEFAKNGFWTDITYDEINNTQTSARGDVTYTGTGNGSFPLYVYLPENASTANRTYTMTVSLVGDENVRETRTITQLPPAWSGDAGWEQIQDLRVPFGFDWDYVVCYGYTYTNTLLQTNANRNFCNKVIEKGGATNYATLKEHYYDRVGLSDRYRYYIEVDYGKLNAMNFDYEFSNSDGLKNTEAILDYAGFVATRSFQTYIEAVKKSETGHEQESAFRMGNGTTGEAPAPTGNRQPGENNAVSECLKKNRYNLRITQGENNKVTKPEFSSDGIVWYLPASGQFGSLPATVKDAIVPADCWSSTVVKAAGTDGRYYTKSGAGADVWRLETKGVRAVRKPL